MCCFSDTSVITKVIVTACKSSTAIRFHQWPPVLKTASGPSLVFSFILRLQAELMSLKCRATNSNAPMLIEHTELITAEDNYGKGQQLAVTLGIWCPSIFWDTLKFSPFLELPRLPRVHALCFLSACRINTFPWCENRYMGHESWSCIICVVLAGKLYHIYHHSLCQLANNLGHNAYTSILTRSLWQFRHNKVFTCTCMDTDLILVFHWIATENFLFSEFKSHGVTESSWFLPLRKQRFNRMP